MRITFLGVRGSTPAPGAEFIRYGGHTSCVAVSAGPDKGPTLVLDAGTGLRNLSGLLGAEPFRGSILLSHLHWDHVQGIPFARAIDRDDAQVHLVMPAQLGRSGRDLLAQLLSPPAFPITPEGLRGRWSFAAVEPGQWESGEYTVTALEISHKGGRTYGYVVSCPTGSLAYLPDHAPAAGMDEALLSAISGVDVLIHDAQFVESERALADDYGHATVGDSVALAERVGAGALVLFHHGPHRSDDALDGFARTTLASMPVLVAREGQHLDLP